MDLHPDCAPLAFLLGTWKGSGVGDYPTIERFHYTEEVTFGHVGKPFLSYTQRTRHRDTEQPLHAETGYLRAVGGAQIEFVVVQPSGIVESHHGQLRDPSPANGSATGPPGVGVLELELDTVVITPSAKSVTDVRREIRVESVGDDQVLTYDVSMAAVGQPMTHHLHAELVRQPDS